MSAAVSQEVIQQAAEPAALAPAPMEAPYPVPYPVPYPANPYEAPSTPAYPANPYETPSTPAYSASTAAPAVAEVSSPQLQYCRLLKVANQTKEPLTVYLRYETLDKDNEWIWVTGSDEKDGWLGPYKIAPGQSVHLKHQGVMVFACRAILLARDSSGRAVTAATGDDRWVVEENAEGERAYLADEVETYVWRIRPGDVR